MSTITFVGRTLVFRAHRMMIARSWERVLVYTSTKTRKLLLPFRKGNRNTGITTRIVVLLPWETHKLRVLVLVLIIVKRMVAISKWQNLRKLGRRLKSRIYYLYIRILMHAYLRVKTKRYQQHFSMVTSSLDRHNRFGLSLAKQKLERRPIIIRINCTLAHILLQRKAKLKRMV